MADPITWVVMLGVASAGMQAKSQYDQGKAAKAQGESEQAWANYNAEVAQHEANQKDLANSEEGRRARSQAQRIQATQRAKYAASGLALEGTPLLVMEETAMNLEKDILELSLQGELESGKLRSQAGISLLQGQAAKQRGNNLANAYNMQAGASLLSGAAGVAGTYVKAKGNI